MYMIIGLLIKELLDKRPLMFTNRLRRMVSFVGKCIKGKLQINDESGSRRLNMLTQPKYNSMCGHVSNILRYQGAKLWNEVDNQFKTAGNYDT